MSLLVREKPPIRLNVGVAPPSGGNYRWAADDPQPGNQPQSLTFGTTMPGGFSSFGLTLQRNPRLSYPDLEELSDITVRGPGGDIAWQGRLETLPDTGGSQAQVSPAGSGWQAHLQDDDSAAMIYLDQALSNWQGTPLARQIALVTAGFQSSDGTDAADPAGISKLQVGWQDSFAASQASESWYDSGAASPIAQVYWTFEPTASLGGNANFTLAVFLSDDTLESSEVNTGNLYPGHTTGDSGLFSPGSDKRYAVLQQSWAAGAGGTDGDTYQSWWQVAVLGDHGLTVQGSWPGTVVGSIGLLASDVIGHAVNRWAPKLNFTTGALGSIQPSGFAIPQLAFTTPTTASAIVQQAAQYEILDWAVWENRTFYLNPFGQSAKTRNWRARMGECQLQETGPDIARLFNGVLVQFTNVDGTGGTVGPPGSGAQTTDPSLLDSDPQNPANQAGIRRWGTVQIGTSTPAAAIQVGARYLAAQAQLNTSGQASLVGHVMDDHGVYWPAWEVRGGDTLTVVDASDTSPRRIVSTNYTDADKTNAVSLDQPPDTTTALLERMSESIQPLGLS